MSSWKQKSKNRFEIMQSIALLVILFWMPMYMAITVDGSDIKSEYEKYAEVFRSLSIMLWTGELMDSHTLYGDYR